jgi:hypothetical protein
MAAELNRTGDVESTKKSGKKISMCQWQGVLLKATGRITFVCKTVI